MTELTPITKPDWKSTMSEERLKLLHHNFELYPTAEEIKNGWHFCYEYDGLLVNAFDPEMRATGCRCLDEFFANLGQRIVD